MMQMLGRYYVQYFNHMHKRTGTLWEGRYKASLIDTENYLLTCMRYIELNPVRARGMVDHPAEYTWSSYQRNALGIDDSLITLHLLYKHLGKSLEARCLAYKALFKHSVEDKTLEEIHAAANKAWVFGSDSSIKQINEKINRQASPKQRGGDRKSLLFSVINRV